MAKKNEVKEVKTEKKTTKKAETFGIIIAALDNPYYGNYAFQLVLSLRHTAPNLNISLLCNDKGKSHLTEEQLSLFDKIIKVSDQAVISRGRKSTLKFKTFLYDVSPYDITLTLDADILFLPNRSIFDLINEIPKDCVFTMQNRGAIDLKTSTEEQLNSRFTIWGNSSHIKSAHNLTEGKLYNLSSELIYFKKDDKVKKLFKDAQKLYDAPGIDYEVFNGGVPDELSFSISMIKNDIYPHVENWRPIYWESFDKKQLLNNPKSLSLEYYGVSFGGNFQMKAIKKYHDNLVRYYANAWGLQKIFPLKDKRDFLPNRHTI